MGGHGLAIQVQVDWNFLDRKGSWP